MTANDGIGDLAKGVGALQAFQKRVNTLLQVLEGSAGSGTKIAAQRVSRASFSGVNAKFAEADGLYTQYNRVHQQLTSLSKTLGMQIEMMSIGVHASEVGYGNVEEDVRRRFAAIDAELQEEQKAQARAQAEYERAHESARQQGGQPGTTDAAATSTNKPRV